MEILPSIGQMEDDYKKSIELYIYLKSNDINVNFAKSMLPGVEIILLKNYKLSIQTSKIVTDGFYAELCLKLNNEIIYKSDWGYENVKRFPDKVDILKEYNYISEKIINSA